MSTVEQLVLQAKTCFQNKDYETCMSLAHEVLRADAGNTEASWLLKEAQRQWEDQRSLEQLEIYVENLKREAMDLFDKERYDQCLGMFRFLSELEPENHTLRDYLRLSQQMYVETIGSKEPANGDPLIAGDPNVETQFEPSCTATEPRDEDRLDRPEEVADSATEAAPVAIPDGELAHAVVIQAESVPPDVKQQIIQECIASTTQSRPKWHWTLLLTASVILLLGLGAAAFWPHLPSPEGRIEIQSTPEGAIVYVDDKSVGETPLRQQTIAVGGHVVRIEKQGYESYSRKLAAEPEQSIILAVQLEKVKVALPVEQAAPPAEFKNEAPVTVPEGQPAPTPLATAVSPVEVETPSVQLAQSVIHHHLIGSCTGRLKIDGDRISFWSSGNSQDSFTHKIKQIIKFELNENLMIEFKDKTYRFESLVRDKDNHQSLTSFYEQIRLQKSHKRL